MDVDELIGEGEDAEPRLVSELVFFVRIGFQRGRNKFGPYNALVSLAESLGGSLG